MSRPVLTSMLTLVVAGLLVSINSNQAAPKLAVAKTDGANDTQRPTESQQKRYSPSNITIVQNQQNTPPLSISEEQNGQGTEIQRRLATFTC
jgi:hypothetical protein